MTKRQYGSLIGTLFVIACQLGAIIGLLFSLLEQR